MDEPLDVEIEFVSQDGPSVIESLPVTHLGENRYRAEGSAVFGAELYWHDEFELECTDQAPRRFVRIVQRSGLRVDTFVIPKKVAKSQRLRSVLRDVLESGGNWEVIYGGVLLTHLPADADIDVRELLDRVIADESR